jgi:hypothetical protein
MFRRKAATADVKGVKNLNRSKTSVNGLSQPVQIDPWEKTSIRREDAVELLKACCDELRNRGKISLVLLIDLFPSSSVKNYP